MAGVFIGDSLLILATALGAISVLTAYPALFMLIKFLGAAYLLYIGGSLMFNAFKSWRTLDDKNLHKVTLIKKSSPAKAFRKALLVSLLNPKAILFFLSFFVQFVDPEYAQPVIPFLILAVTLQLFSLIYLALLIYAGSKLAETFKKRKKVSAISSVGVGSGFVLFAIKLAFASA